MPTRTIVTPEPLDLPGTLFPIVRGRGDPTMAIHGSEALRATRTPDGPATVHLRASASHIECEAWGTGAERALHDAPALVGALDDWSAFTPHDDVVRRLRHDNPGLRLTRTGSILAALILRSVSRR